jgi:hypothetical protein
LCWPSRWDWCWAWGPTSAQFFNFGGYQQRPQPQRGGGWFGNEQRGGGWFGNDTYAPYQQQYAPPRHGRQAPPASREDFSKAPPPEKRNTAPERHILVLGDSMADWLAYGLEDVYADQPEMGVVRKHKTASGLIKYQPKGNPAGLGRRRQRHSRHRKSGRHCRHARA